MRFAVDPAGKTADDHHTRSCKLASEHARHLGPVGRTGTRADDRDRRTSEQRRVTLTAQVEPSRRIVNCPKQRRQLTLAYDPHGVASSFGARYASASAT